MREIPLTQGYVALVDDNDYEWLSQWKWCVSLMQSGPRAVRNALVDGKRKTICMSRQLMNSPIGMVVDHWDHNTLNNQRANLRRCTKSQNGANRRKTAGCSSRFKGVTWVKREGKWIAHIKVAGRNKHLGYFVDEVAAALAYNVEAAQQFEEFALLNDV